MLVSSEILARIKQIEFKARYLVTDAVAGDYLSAFKGRGMDFDEVRPYVPGDDVRLIDWNVTARAQEPFVKLHREEREFTVMMLVDTSASLGFGTASRFKKDLAAEVAAIFALMATKNNDRVGMIGFSDKVNHAIEPRKGRSHIWNIIRLALDHQSSGGGTDLKPAVDCFLNVIKRRSLCVVISDFRHMQHLDLLRKVGSRHDLICVELSDEREVSLPNVGCVVFHDMETGEVVDIDLSSHSLRSAWQVAESKRRADLLSFFRSLDAGLLTIETEQDPIVPIEVFMRQRLAKRARYG